MRLEVKPILKAAQQPGMMLVGKEIIVSYIEDNYQYMDEDGR